MHAEGERDTLAGTQRGVEFYVEIRRRGSGSQRHSGGQSDRPVEAGSIKQHDMEIVGGERLAIYDSPGKAAAGIRWFDEEVAAMETAQGVHTDAHGVDSRCVVYAVHRHCPFQYQWFAFLDAAIGE